MLLALDSRSIKIASRLHYLQSNFREGQLLMQDLQHGNVKDSAVVIKYKVYIVDRLYFGSLELFFDKDVKSITDCFIVAFNTVNTGALNGLSTDHIQSHFQQFNVILTSATGEENNELDANANSGYGKVSYHAIKLGPYAIEKITEGGAFVTFIKEVKDDIEKYIKDREERFTSGELFEAVNLYHAYHSDESKTDIIFQHFIESLKIKFIPRSLTMLDEHSDTEEEEEEPLISSKSRRVGCLPTRYNQLDSDILRDQHLWTPLNTDNHNCLFQCIREYIYSVVNLPLEEKDREELNEICDFYRERDVPIDDLQIQQLCDRYAINLFYYEIVDTPYAEKTNHIKMDEVESKIIARFQKMTHQQLLHSPHYPLQAHIIIHKEHSYLVKNAKYILNKVKCDYCMHWINFGSFGRHSKICRYCKVCARSYTTKKGHTCDNGQSRAKRVVAYEKRKNQYAQSNIVSDNWLPLNPLSKKNKRITNTLKNVWAADIEAFSNVESDYAFTPYAISLVNVSDYATYKCFWGENCMRDFLRFTMSDQVKGAIHYYNGGRFDAYLHLNAMIKHGYYIDPTSIIKNGGTIMSFKAKPNLKVKDLCLFLQNSLSKACDEWGIPDEYKKGDFDHNKIFNWHSAEDHKEEVLEYLKNDVLALAELYKKYSGIMLDIFHLDIYNAITPSQYAMQTWLSLFPEDDFPEMYIPHSGKEEDDFRAAYYGGRVTPQRKQFISKDFSEQLEQLAYESIEDYLFYCDVNSLYPAAQHRFKYAHGKWEYHQRYTAEQLNAAGLDDNTIDRCQFKVTIECPKDLLTPFLVSRNPATKSMEHSLDTKVECWYWGSEIREALLLGYRVVTLHETLEFEKLSDLFSKYVDICWQGRLDNPKKGPNANPTKNLAFKLAMNRLTGKFGQNTHLVNWAILNTNQVKGTAKDDKTFKSLLSRINDFTPIFCESGNIAVVLELDAEDKNPDYPIYLSAQILAYSRVMMSEVMRAGDCYRNEDHALYYTDTDSLVLSAKVFPQLRDAGLFGSRLGQLSCDLHDWANQAEADRAEFSKIVKGIWAAPKGPYSLVYVDPRESAFKEKIRTKGIPHSKQTFKYKSPNVIKEDTQRTEELAHIEAWLMQPTLYQVPKTFIGKRFYVFELNATKEKYFAERLTYAIIEQMMRGEGQLTCLFGTMKKTFMNDQGKILEIRPDVVRRMPCRINWWEAKALRFAKDKEDPLSITYPLGYERDEGTQMY